MISLELASIVVDAALKKSAEAGGKPLAVAVLDAGGHLKAFKRQDGSSILRFEIASGKAYGALGMGMGSRALGQRAAERPAFFGSVVAASGGRVVLAPGGVLIRSAGGEILGAVGISGDAPEKDEEFAVAGVQAAGLVADPG